LDEIHCSKHAGFGKCVVDGAFTLESIRDRGVVTGLGSVLTGRGCDGAEAGVASARDAALNDTLEDAFRKEALAGAPMVPLGPCFSPMAYRSNLSSLVKGADRYPWSTERA